jgi:hypothetical protein
MERVAKLNNPIPIRPTKRKEHQVKKVLLLSFSLLIAAVISCQRVGQSRDNSLLKPGDEIGSMIITTGTYDSPPLWAFCSLIREDGHATSVDCQVPPLHRLAIGHTLGVANPALQSLDWSALNWELSLDGQAIDLKAFGTNDFVRPDLAPSPSLVRKIFRKFKAWDVILINPSPGVHTLAGTAYDEAETYTWMVNFTVEASLTL